MVYLKHHHHALAPDETVQWLGMPSMKAFTVLTTLGFLFSMPILFFSFAAFAVGIEEWRNMGMGFLVFSLILGTGFLVVGLLLLVGPFFRYRKATKFLYLVTDRRVMILPRKWSAVVQCCPVEQIHNLVCEEKPNGLGNLTIWAQPVNVQGVFLPAAVLCFSQIQYPQAVGQLIRKLAARNLQGGTPFAEAAFPESINEPYHASVQEWPNFATDHPVLLRENIETYKILPAQIRDALNATLQQGEQIKWIDVPYQKRGFTVITTLLVILGIPTILIGLLMFVSLFNCDDWQACVIGVFMVIFLLGLGVFAITSPARTLKRNFKMLYAITGRRVIAFDSRWAGQEESSPLDQLGVVYLWPIRNGLGSLSFSGLCSTGFDPTQYGTGAGFRLIKNAFRIHCLLETLATPPVIEPVL